MRFSFLWLASFFTAPLVVACSSDGLTQDRPPAHDQQDSGSATDSGPDVRADADPDAALDGSACSCTAVGDADLSSVYVTSLPCYCGRSSCSTYDETLSSLCSRNPIDAVESTFAGCHLKRITYTWGASGVTEVFDTTSGDMVGGRFDDDTPGRCPGTDQAIGFSLAAGVYEVDPSCQLTNERHLCEATDGGPDASADAPACSYPPVHNDPRCPTLYTAAYDGKTCSPVGLSCAYPGAGDGMPDGCLGTAGLSCRGNAGSGDGGPAGTWIATQ
jgi:hypothetical protein